MIEHGRFLVALLKKLAVLLMKFAKSRAKYVLSSLRLTTTVFAADAEIENLIKLKANI